MAAVPAWKQAILNKKREKEEEEERARRVEEDKLKKLPQWKRDLLLRKQASEDRGSPPLNRASLNKASKVGRTGSLTKKTLPQEKHTLGAGRDRADSDAGSDHDSSTTPSATQPAAPPPSAKPASSEAVEPRSPTATSASVPSTEESTSVDDVDGARPSVKDLLGLFGAGRARSGSEERHGADAGLEAHSGSIGEERTAHAAPARRPSAQAAVAAVAAAASATNPPASSALMTGQTGAAQSIENDDEEECTLIDDVVPDELPKPQFNRLTITPPRQTGIQSAPASPTATLGKARMERRPSALVSGDRPRKVKC